jgi:hypothetical protein
MANSGENSVQSWTIEGRFKRHHIWSAENQREVALQHGF